MIKWRRLLFLAFTSALLLQFSFISIPVNADTLSISVGLITSEDNIGIQGVQGQSCSINNQSGYFQNTSTNDYCAVNRMTWGSYISSLGWGIGNGNYLKISFYGYELRDREAIHSVQNNGFQGYIWVDGTERTLIPVGFSGGMTSESSALFEYIFKYEGPSGTITRLDLAPGVAVAPNELYRMGMIALYGVSGASADYSSQLSDLIRQNEAIINKLGEGNVNDATIINSAQQQVTAINNQTQAINNQTQAINNQTDAINDQTDVINDVKDTITDNSVDTANIDYSDIADSVPSFGPIATIINNLIDFPRVFLTDTVCQPLNTPIPDYIGADPSTYLVIPCPSDFLEPYWPAIEVIEGLAAAYIYFKVAVFVVRQVEYMRDPERDDEEFLKL